MSKLKTTKQIITEFKEVHGVRYDYSEVNYTGAREPVTVICYKHGKFYPTPHNHRHGSGCMECGKIRGADKRRKSAEEFITKAKEVHGDLYDYSEAVPSFGSSKVIIICRIHGKFHQNVTTHLAGTGCRKCGYIKVGDKARSTTEEFITKAKEVHGDLYDYSKVEYDTSVKKITIICSIHDEFLQTPSDHLSGYGCGKCGDASCGLQSRSNTKEFVTKAKEVHGDMYGYSEVDYTTSTERITIICPIHDEFLQTPSDHLSGCGCPTCGAGAVSSRSRDWLNSLNIPTLELEYRVCEFDNGKSYRKVDGYDPQTHTIYEYHGGYWHGDYRQKNCGKDVIHGIHKIPMTKVRERSDRRDQELRDAGYNLVIMWEYDWRKSQTS